MNKRYLAFVIILASVAAPVIAAEAGPRSATVPMALDHNRMTVEVDVHKSGGTWKKVRAWVDTGGTDMIIAGPLALELGIELPAGAAGAGQTVATKIPVPALRLGSVPLDVEGMTVAVRPGKFPLPGIEAECVLPPRCLRRLHVVFDYPARKLTVAAPGALTHRGTAVPCRVNPETGLFMIEATIDGEKVALGVDTGSAGTWVSDKLASAWLARHPEWPHALGAAGSTNFFGFPFEAKGVLLCLPAFAIGTVHVDREVAVLGLDQGLFDWYAQKSAAPVSGFLGAEALARFRLEVDFPVQMTWWLPGAPAAARDLDMVGLTLRPEADDSYFVAGVVSRDGRVLVAGVEPGDRLLKVDGLEVTGAFMGMVIGALRGKPGETRLLLLERQGKPLTVRATVMRLP
jgi:predicted aspartyl protease